MGSVYTSIHEPIALELRDRYGLRAFVETGLYQGHSALWAWANGFYPVVSLELSRIAIREFKREHQEDLERIQIVHGDSGKDLYGALTKITTPPLIWLDAHSVPETPVLAEIEQVFRWTDTAALDYALMIDDVRLFGVQGQWPQLHRVIELLETRCECYVKDDVVVAVQRGMYEGRSA